MNAQALTHGTNLRAAPTDGAEIIGVLGRVLAVILRWRQQAHDRRELARCAAAVGHRFAGDTLIS